jgi:hypothetical protein
MTLLIPRNFSYLRRHSHLRGNKTEENSKKTQNFIVKFAKSVYCKVHLTYIFKCSAFFCLAMNTVSSSCDMSTA